MKEMLIQFSVENFRSFSKRAVLSMAPNNKLENFKEHILDINGSKVLKGAFIYGANASGKSNFVKAMYFAQTIILDGLDSVRISNQHYRLEKSYANKGGTFQFEFACDSAFYSYGFAIQYSTKQVLAEWLYEIRPSGREKRIFERKNNEVFYDEGKSKKTDSRLKTYNKDLKTINPTLFLTEIANKRVSNSESAFFKTVNSVYNWFTRLVIIFPDSHYRNLLKSLQDEKLNNEFKTLVSFFDTGINDFKMVPGSIDDLLADASERDRHDLLNQIKKDAIGKEVTISVNDQLALLKMNKKGELSVQKLNSIHGDIAELFELTDESDGTRRLFDLIPMCFSVRKSFVFIIDELDRSLHPNLVVAFVKKFFDSPNNDNVQMIATTHQAELMDFKILRRDEIWLIEKEGDGSSKLYSLDEFKLRSDKDINAAYLLGRFGGVPVFESCD